MSVCRNVVMSLFDNYDDSLVSDFGRGHLFHHMSSLCYMNVSMRCVDGDVRKTVSALCDSGSQMTLVRSELLDDCE